MDEIKDKSDHYNEQNTPNRQNDLGYCLGNKSSEPEPTSAK
jgi:hypothetical protein